MNTNRNYIKAMYLLANEADKDHGYTWYNTAHRIAVNISSKCSIPIERVAAVIAALSPRNRWERNLQDAENLCLAWSNKDNPDNVKVATFGSNKRKAWSILNGTPINEVLKGNKVYAFYSLINNPNSEYVVVDSHAYSVWSGSRITKTPKISDALYTTIGNDYDQVAHKLGITPAELQAITWVTFKRIHNI